MGKVILKIVIFTIALFLKDVSSNNCASQRSCGKCISENLQCAWCSQENYADNGSPKCDYIMNLRKRNCNPEHIIAPVNHMKIIQDREIGHWRGEDIHIRPQEINITIRPNSVHRFMVEFRQIDDYPLDLYLILDLSTAENRQEMVQLGYKLAEELPKITSDFRIGFGTFVQKQRKSCLACAPSYAFRNVMSLSNESKTFAHIIKEETASVNLNAPDGGTNVIMQAIMCKAKIGWRINSRKILLYASDKFYNYPEYAQHMENLNAKFCQLDSNGYFIKGTDHQYTSINQIKSQISKNNMHIIFAVSSLQRQFYLGLKRNLNSSVATLDGDLSKIIDLIREQYGNIRSSVKMGDNLQSNNIKLTYYAKCRGSQFQKTNYCEGLKKGSEVTFKIEMELNSCPSERTEWNKTFQIYPFDLYAFMIVNLKIQCECGCEKTKEIRSLKCDGIGTFECGGCTCNEHFYGSECECNVIDKYIPLDPYTICKKNANDNIVCSGRGSCRRCEGCDCFNRQNPNEIVSGRFCECDNFSCKTYKGKICGGPNHGTCDCGKCVCKTGWKGSDCSCKYSSPIC